MAPVRGRPAASRLPAPRGLRGSPHPSPGRGRPLLPARPRLTAPLRRKLKLLLLPLPPRAPPEELGVLASASGAERRRRRRLNRTIAM